MRIAVAGGTGVVGRLVTGLLADAGDDPVVLSRGHGVDLTSSGDLAATLDGCSAVVDVTSIAATREPTSTEFFTGVTRALVRAGATAGVTHHVALSIVGIDGSAYGYYRGKLAHEATLAASDAPWSLLRATQFHELAGQLLERTRRGPVGVVPRMRIRPVAAATVAAQLVGLARGPVLGRVPDLAGPAEEDLAAMARAVARRHGVRRVVGVPLPGRAGRQMRDGSLLPGPATTTAGPSFGAWLRGSGT